MTTRFSFHASSPSTQSFSIQDLYPKLRTKLSKKKGWTGKIACARAKSLIILDTVSKKCIHEIEHPDDVNYVIQLRNGSLLASNKNKNIYMYDSMTAKCIQIFVGHSSSVFNLLELQNGNIVAEDDGQELRVWTPYGRCIKEISFRDGFANFTQLRNGNLLYTHESNYLKMWDLANEVPEETLQIGDDVIFSMHEIRPNVLLACDGSGYVHLHDMQQKKEILKFRAHEGMIFTSVVLHDGSFVTACNSDEKGLTVWNEQGECLVSVEKQLLLDISIFYMNKIAEIEPGVIAFQCKDEILSWNVRTNIIEQCVDVQGMLVRCFIF
jgi:WD40 repeat protein